MLTTNPNLLWLFAVLIGLLTTFTDAKAANAFLRGISLKSVNVQAQTSAQRVALVIGNSQYRALSSLKNPSNDARAMAQSLTRLGFEVDLRINNNHRQMTAALVQFSQKLTNPNQVALFYYAGHGVQIDGSNYLLPVDAQIFKSSDVQFEALNLAKVLNAMAEHQQNLNIVILDACRDNPFPSNFRSLKRGLAQLSAPTGTLLAYATAPGAVASDGNGDSDNGVYTSALLNYIETPGLSVEKLFKQVRQTVVNETNWLQVPWESSSLLGDFYFAGKATAPPKKTDKPSNNSQDCQTQLIDQRPLECLFGDAQ